LLQGKFKGGSRLFQECFMGAAKVLLGRFKDVSKKFKGVSMVFRKAS